jgi:hypothetical protein
MQRENQVSCAGLMAIERLTVESGRCPTDSLEYLPYSARTPSTRSQDVLDPPTTISSTIPVKPS